MEVGFIARAIMAAEKRGEEREREAIAVWIDTQRTDVPAYGWEFVAAIRNRTAS